MSHHASNLVWKDADLVEKSELLVMLALADQADDSGFCYPSIDYIARKTRCSIRGVQSVLRLMEANGKLGVTPNAGRSGTNLYQIYPADHCTPPRNGRHTPRNGTPTPATIAPSPPQPSGVPLHPNRNESPEAKASGMDAGMEAEPVEVSPEAEEFLERWHEAYEPQFCTPFKSMTPEEDARNVSALMAEHKLGARELIALALEAWRTRGREYPACAKAVTVAALVAHFPEISAELKAARKKPQPVDDDAWLNELEKSDACRGIDVRRELAKMLLWCQTNHRSPSRRRFVNWLSRADRTMGAAGITQPIHRADKIDREYKENISSKQL